MDKSLYLRDEYHAFKRKNIRGVDENVRA